MNDNNCRNHKKLVIAAIMIRTLGKNGHYDTAVVLQDHKRLPARFFSLISGALNSRLA